MPRLRDYSPHIPQFKFNPIIRILTFIDALVWAGYFMNNAIVAIYLSDRIGIDPIRAIGFGYAIFLVSRSLFQIPIAKFLDSKKSINELYAISTGGLLIALSFISYLFISHEYHLYLTQAVFGLGAAIYLPAWKKTYTKNVDVGGEGSDWATTDTITALSAAALTAVAAFVVSRTDSFTYLFFIASFLAVIGALSVLALVRSKKIKAD